MKLLLDGYNILKKYIAHRHISEQERFSFIRKVNTYARLKKLEIIIVFDGGPHTWPERTQASKLVSVVYSGSQENADDYIKNFLDHQSNKDMILVSSDRELIYHAQRMMIYCLDAADFLTLLQDTNENTINTQRILGQTHQMTQHSTQELNTLMEQLTIPASPTTSDKPHRKKTKTLSKKERAFLQKLKKL